MFIRIGLRFASSVFLPRHVRVLAAGQIIMPLVGRISSPISTSTGWDHHFLRNRYRDRSTEPEDYDVKVNKDELRERLNPMQYHVTQEKGTEKAFTGEYYQLKDDGHFHCVVCDNVLFKSTDKFESGSGWPSFSDMAATGTVKQKQDFSHGMVRTEVVCTKCGSHLGHVFEDGPKPSGLRYCVNSASLNFKGNSKPKSEL